MKQQEASSEELEQLSGESLGQVFASANTLGANCMADRASMPAEEIDFLKAIASVDLMNWRKRDLRGGKQRSPALSGMEAVVI